MVTTLHDGDRRARHDVDTRDKPGHDAEARFSLAPRAKTFRPPSVNHITISAPTSTISPPKPSANGRRETPIKALAPVRLMAMKPAPA